MQCYALAVRVTTQRAKQNRQRCCRSLRQHRPKAFQPKSMQTLTLHHVLAPSARPMSAAKQSGATVCGSSSSAYARYGVLERVAVSCVLPLRHAPSRCPGAWRSGRPRGSARCSGGAATCGSPTRAPRFCAARALGVSNWGLLKGPGLHRHVESSSVLLSTALTLARRAWKQHTKSQLCTLHCCTLNYSASFVRFPQNLRSSTRATPTLCSPLPLLRSACTQGGSTAAL